MWPRPRELAAVAPCSRRRCCAALLWGVASAAVAAQPAGDSARDVVVSSTLERIVAAADGAPATVGVTAGTVASHADQLIVSVRFTNVGESVVDTVRITSPIPGDVKYVSGSASGPGGEALFSVDNGRTFGRPEELTRPTPDGGLRRADAADYTHVRWILSAPLDAGASGVARFRAVPR